MKKPKKKRVYIRCCDLEDADVQHTWSVFSGNGDAFCNEENCDPHCSVCPSKWTCDFAIFGSNCSEYYGLRQLSENKLVKLRKKKRNTELCLKCAYNDTYDMVWLSLKEIRKVKLTQIDRELKYGKVIPGNHYGTYGYKSPKNENRR